jgi:K+/H+ antiporter YhaU regulatory subunit KhtT
MAATAINPAATDFIEGLRLAENSHVTLYEFIASPSVEGKPLGSMDFKNKTGALVVAVRTNDGFIANPSDNLLLHAGAAIIAIGDTDELKRMGTLLGAEKPQIVSSQISSE